MNNSEQHMDKASRFYERYADFSNQQIKDILKNHKDYQESAVTAAVKIAIERELIHTEQDLLGPEYQSQMSYKWSVFPEIHNAYLYKRVRASIFRVLFFASLIPTIYGVMKYAEGQFNMTYLGVGAGLTWFLLTFILFKTEKLVVLFLQVVMIILVFFILGYWLLSQHYFQTTDIAVLVIGTMVLLYLLFYLKKLIQTKPEEIYRQ
ncbi:MAG TPA: hypothetical protein DCL77_04645 [Prolixibacteraceae bacterium]|jgi:cation transport ATPase|nr:hypothetical protein [Prolixibacteraceae bacterium]